MPGVRLAHEPCRLLCCRNQCPIQRLGQLHQLHLLYGRAGSAAHSCRRAHQPQQSRIVSGAFGLYSSFGTIHNCRAGTNGGLFLPFPPGASGIVSHLGNYRLDYRDRYLLITPESSVPPPAISPIPLAMNCCATRTRQQWTHRAEEPMDCKLNASSRAIPIAGQEAGIRDQSSTARSRLLHTQNCGIATTRFRSDSPV